MNFLVSKKTIRFSVWVKLTGELKLVFKFMLNTAQCFFFSFSPCVSNYFLSNLLRETHIVIPLCRVCFIVCVKTHKMLFRENCQKQFVLLHEDAHGAHFHHISILKNWSRGINFKLSFELHSDELYFNSKFNLTLIFVVTTKKHSNTSATAGRN